MHKIPNFNWMSVWQVQEQGSEGSAMSVKTPGWFLPTKESTDPNRVSYVSSQHSPCHQSTPGLEQTTHPPFLPLVSWVWWDKWRRNHWGHRPHVLLPARFKAKGFNKPSFKGCTHNHSSFHNATLKPAPGSHRCKRWTLPCIEWRQCRHSLASPFPPYADAFLPLGSLDFNTVLKKYFRPAPVYWHSFPKGTAIANCNQFFWNIQTNHLRHWVFRLGHPNTQKHTVFSLVLPFGEKVNWVIKKSTGNPLESLGLYGKIVS